MPTWVSELPAGKLSRPTKIFQRVRPVNGADDAAKNGRLTPLQAAIAEAYDAAWRLVSVLPMPPGQADTLRWRHETVKNAAVTAAGKAE